MSDTKRETVIIGNYYNSRPTLEQIRTLARFNVMVLSEPVDPHKQDKQTDLFNWALTVPENYLYRNNNEPDCRAMIIVDGTKIATIKNSGIIELQDINKIQSDPPQNQSVMDQLTAYCNDDKYKGMRQKYAAILSEYIGKLESEMNTTLKLTRVMDQLVRREYEAPPEKEVERHLAWNKLNIVQDAYILLSRHDLYNEEAITKSLEILKKPENRNVLKQRRDSWLVNGLKIAGSLGAILIYRYLMGDEVTQGIRNVNAFEKEYNNKTLEPKTPTANEEPASFNSAPTLGGNKDGR